MAGDYDVYVEAIDYTDYDEHGNPADGWQEEMQRVNKIRKLLEDNGGMDMPVSFTDGDGESGMCSPEMSEVFKMPISKLHSLVAQGDLDIMSVLVYRAWDKNSSRPVGLIA